MKYNNFADTMQVLDKILTIFKLNKNNINVEIINNILYFQSNNRSSIEIRLDSNSVHKILTVDVYDENSQKMFNSLRYKKKVGIEKDYPKQRPSKESLFNHGLEMNVLLSFEQYEELEKLIDNLEYNIQIHAFLRV